MFKKTLISATLLTLLIAGTAQAQITTGTGTPPTINDVGGYALDSTDWLAGQITLNGAQTITSIQEQTLSFVPKLLGCGLCLWLTAPWILQQLGNLFELMMVKAGTFTP